VQHKTFLNFYSLDFGIKIVSITNFRALKYLNNYNSYVVYNSAILEVHLRNSMTKQQYIYGYDLIYKAEKKTFETIDSFKVMQGAAKACYSFILKNLTTIKILVLCGPGNNGGDGVLIAQHLHEQNFFADIYYPFGRPKTNDSKKALDLLSNKESIKENICFDTYDLIIDALFGTGLNRILDPTIASIFNKINKSKAKTISIDMPSGVLTDNGQINGTAIKADITLSLHRFKPGQWLLPGKEYCGKIVLLDIGLVNIDDECFLQLNYPLKPPIPSLSNNKFSRGCCFVVAGENLIGASKLAYLSASQSALRAGTGLCKLLVNKKNMEFFQSHVLEEMLVTYKNNKDFFSIIKSQKCNTLIYGCGIDNTSANKEILTFLLEQEINLVLDATIFSLFQESKKEFLSLLNQRTMATIMTPHAGEFKRLFNTTNNKIIDCLNAAKESNSIIVYKGNDTVIGSPGGHGYINTESSPYLATAGSGDVLAGIIGGFLSQGIDALSSSRLGCYIHSQCGINLGLGLTAGDLVKEIPNVIKKMNN